MPTSFARPLLIFLFIIFFFSFFFSQYSNLHLLVHLADELVDEVLPVAGITALDEVVGLLVEAAGRGAEAEGVEEIVGLGEGLADGEDFVDQVLHAHDAVLLEGLLDDGVAGQRDALVVDLAEPALVHELLDGLEVGVAREREKVGLLIFFKLKLKKNEQK
jgi:hypothetical protein